MKMHFDCWALVELELIDDGAACIEDACLVGGFFPTRQSIAPFVRSVALADMKFSEEFAQTWMVRPRYKRRTYEAIPLHNVHFSDLSDLEKAICESAKLRWAGIGK
jgi:hypothetical protein